MAEKKTNFQELRENLRESAKKEVFRLQDEAAKHEAQFKKLNAKRDDLNDQIEELKRQRDQIVKQLQEEDLPDRNRINTELTEVAKLAGARGLGDAP
jgi:transposase